MKDFMFSQISSFFSELRLTSCGSYKKRPKEKLKKSANNGKISASLNDLSTKKRTRLKNESMPRDFLLNSNQRKYESELNLEENSSSSKKSKTNLKNENKNNEKQHLATPGSKPNDSKNAATPSKQSAKNIETPGNAITSISTLSTLSNGAPNHPTNSATPGRPNTDAESSFATPSIREKDSFFDSELYNRKNKYASVNRLDNRPENRLQLTQLTKHSSHVNLNDEMDDDRYNVNRYFESRFMNGEEFVNKVQGVNNDAFNNNEAINALGFNKLSGVNNNEAVKALGYNKLSGINNNEAVNALGYNKLSGVNNNAAVNALGYNKLSGVNNNDALSTPGVHSRNRDAQVEKRMFTNNGTDSSPRNAADSADSQTLNGSSENRTIVANGYAIKKALGNKGALNSRALTSELKTNNKQLSYGSTLNLLNICNEQRKASVNDLVKADAMYDQERQSVIKDDKTGAFYVRGRLLGKGGFAHCYELRDLKTKIIFAAKIIPKQRLKKIVEMEKVNREIELHSRLNHANIVKFHSSFEDEKNIYIVLENCCMKTLVHMVKKRRTLTEPEVRYYMLRLTDSVQFIHGQRIIHRDLKLGNMLLNANMQLKVADFGLATYVAYPGEKKMTVCGTPNYIAPEVLQKLGHSYEADTWSMGCIMYALLVGRPPFETTTLKETYLRIANNLYTIPNNVSISAKKLIRQLLENDPASRPALTTVSEDRFFSDGYFPESLSPSCFSKPPRFPVANIVVHKSFKDGYFTKKHSNELMKSASQLFSKNKQSDYTSENKDYMDVGSAPNLAFHLAKKIPLTPLQSMLRDFTDILKDATRYSTERRGLEGLLMVQDEPVTYVVKWVDYSNKYGFGFQLSSQHVGILFNNNCRMLLSEDAKTVYVQSKEKEEDVVTYSVRNIPEDLQKSATLLLYFTQFMEKHLIPGGLVQRPSTLRNKAVFLKQWFRTEKAIVMYLSNNTFQVNFFEDHSKVILSHTHPSPFPPHNLRLIIVDGGVRDVKFVDVRRLREEGCSQWLRDKMAYSLCMLKDMVDILEGENVLDTRV